MLVPLLDISGQYNYFIPHTAMIRLDNNHYCFSYNFDNCNELLKYDTTICTNLGRCNV